MQRTLAEKIWDSHVVRTSEGGESLLYVDLQLLHEVNTPQAFDRLRSVGRRVRRPDLTLGTEDHNTPTTNIRRRIADPSGRRQSELMRSNCEQFGIPLHRLGDDRQGIVHVIAPEQGLVRPGMTIVCCDSHTTTLGAFGALAFGIGASQVEHVLATQTLPMRPLKHMAVTVHGTLRDGVFAKDLVLALIAQIGTAGGHGHSIEYRGKAIEQMSMESRMTLCNMSVEAGSRAGLVAPDETTFRYLRSRVDLDDAQWTEELHHWRSLRTDPGALFDAEVSIDADAVTPFVSWGTNPSQSVALNAVVPAPEDFPSESERTAARQALDYMRLRPGTRLRDVAIDTVFIGSCTNGRIEDLRAAARVLSGRRVSPAVTMIVVAGSAAVRRQAETEGLDEVFERAGATFRAGAGCSLCAALNEDRLASGQRAASTTNRNFEGRQGKGSRTHLVSPAVAAATAVVGKLAMPSDLGKVDSW
ncbi:3-isopropylmalate dehydratase large subunit [Rathayibacter rathayi]|uniref:3-isopropylmalate dehydratase large subunit n=1 Tax=Rathayibacter rathayi TaxID=33887 RepID=UPI000CE86D27|nr:3-isopropylmalate dehydratase large subunit [Rathayibacter rathayi]PPF23383.1 3-isopropylmalate dehydratase large subunit [Rathayibacter rathayi]